MMFKKFARSINCGVQYKIDDCKDILETTNFSIYTEKKKKNKSV